MADKQIPKILIVDDEKPLMEALCNTLREQGYDCAGFISAKEALAELQRSSFDLLLSDLMMMPEMDGISLLKAALKVDANLIGIIMTGHGTIDSAVEAMKIGALDYILKPFKLSAILPVLSRALSVRQLRLENAALQQRVQERTAELIEANEKIENYAKLLEGKVQLTEEKYRLLLERANDAIIVLGPKGKVLEANWQAGRMFGLVRSAIEDADFFTLLPEGQRDRAKEGFRRLTEEKIAFVQEYNLADSHLPGYYVECSISLVDVGEKLAVAIFRNMTERKKAEQDLRKYAEELERSNAELKDFAFIASHDLQEPLRKIETFATMLVDESQGKLDESMRDHLNRVTKSVERMRLLITNISDISRVVTREHAFGPTDLNEVLRDVQSDLEVRFSETGGKIIVDPLPTLEVDGVQIKQLFQNLILNALKFHRPDAKPIIKIRSEMLDGNSAGECRIFVEDNGIGFEDQYADLIFKVFRRLHGNDKYGGTGVGLAICRKVVNRHGGFITAKGVPGVGATFIITLPIHQRKQGVSANLKD